MMSCCRFTSASLPEPSTPWNPISRFGCVGTCETAGVATQDAKRVEQLRLQAEGLCRAGRWADLLSLNERLRDEDPQWWPSFWAPMCAVAARHTGREDARDFLESAIQGGFHQPEFFEDEFAVFVADSDWLQMLDRMHGNVALARVELVEWPTTPPVHGLQLDRLAPDVEDRLRALVPPPLETAWPTALQLLQWVSRRWQHANAHVETQDATEVLARVDAGERFACVEYSTVLSQALNSCGVPARRVNLRASHHHTGVSKGHVVSEAWIDDLDRWILLDGQNGAWWGNPGEPLGVLDLHDRLVGGERPPMNGLVTDKSKEAPLWFRYFETFSSTGITFANPPFAPIFQEGSVIESELLVKDRRQVEPDLAGISTRLVDDDGAAARFGSAHPFASGFLATDGSGRATALGLDASLPFTGDPGEHRYSVATRTPYGTLRPSTLSFVIR